MDDSKKIIREFGPTTLALKNKNTIYLLILIIIVFGAFSYTSLPKELFPEVSIPTILVQTTYPGNPPESIENLISRPLEKELKTIQGVNDVKSISSRDASMIFLEFATGTDIDEVMSEVKDGIDQAKSELPDDLIADPVAMDIDPSEFPVINLNLSGDYSLDQLKEYAEYLQDEIESIYEVSKVQIKGIDEKEVQINVDPNKLDAMKLTFYDIESAITAENVSISGGEIRMGDIRRSVRTTGEFTSINQIKNIIIKYEQGNIVYLKDVANVSYTYEDPKSFARLNKEPVVSVQVIKKGGENLLSAIDQIFQKVEEAKKNNYIPQSLKIAYTNDQSKQIRSQLDNLENSMIMGIIFVVTVLFFFLGLRNAVFVGMAIPMSMLLSFVVLGGMGATINMIVLFSLILALGMLVDNAIVVVENIYRFVDQGYSVMKASRLAVGEIAMPIISSTATTLAAFIPLAFWDGIVGEFMKFLPITLIIVLTSSLVVALVIIPVLASSFIKTAGEEAKPTTRQVLVTSGILLGLAIPLYIAKNFTLANLLALSFIVFLLHVYIFFDLSKWFQSKFLPLLEERYDHLIAKSLAGRMPTYIIIGSVVLLIGTINFMQYRSLDTVFFPENEPQYINIFSEYPIGSDVEKINAKYEKSIEQKVYELMAPYGDLVESVLTTVGEGVKRQNEMSAGRTTNKILTTIKFVDFQFRQGLSTSKVMKMLSDSLQNQYPGVEVFIEKNQNGPPTGSAINIELQGKQMETLIAYSDTIIKHIKQEGIEGIEGLKLDISVGKPDMIVHIDRDKARRFGVSTQQIAGTIRTALFGKDISDYKDGEDEYPIQLRLQRKFRDNISAILDQKITFRNKRGKLMQVPISAVADVSYSSSYGSIKRKNMKRVVSLSSNVIEGYNANNINNQIKRIVAGIDFQDGYQADMTGQQQEQQESMDFMIRALLIAISLILLILVTQFNSFAKPLIIIASVLFSTIGVFGGLATFKMDFVVIMTGIGIISLAGVVVNNAIVLIDYIDYLKANRKKELGLDEEQNLPLEEIKLLIEKAGATRLRPVLLTAITTILGLFPMALGMNIDFVTMLSDFDPQLFFGGDNADFWGPMAWTVIFGLTFATILTLVVVPVMYLLANKIKLRWTKS